MLRQNGMFHYSVLETSSISNDKWSINIVSFQASTVNSLQAVQWYYMPPRLVFGRNDEMQIVFNACEDEQCGVDHCKSRDFYAEEADEPEEATRIKRHCVLLYADHICWIYDQRLTLVRLAVQGLQEKKSCQVFLVQYSANFVK